MPLVEVNGVRDTGHGPPIVLVHGSWDDRHVWALVEDDLAKSFRVVSYDRRGHTDSEESPEPGTRRDDEDDLAALIEALGLAPASLVGNSFGGSITLGLAARRPELVRSVCAMSRRCLPWWAMTQPSPSSSKDWTPSFRLSTGITPKRALGSSSRW